MSTKPKLAINYFDMKYHYGTLGMSELLTFLNESGLFEVEEHKERLQVMRGERATILYYNSKKIYLDFWDYATPTWTGEVYNAGFDLIIKLQQRIITPTQLESACQHKNTFLGKTPEERWAFYQKIVPWTFFCSKLLSDYVGKEDVLSELRKKPVDKLGFFCGKDWKVRRFMKKKLMDSGIEYTVSNQALRRGKPLKDREYLDKMLSSKYGIVLAGRGSFFSEAKNRREIDYMMLRKPLLIDYKPNYYNPMVEGKHFIHITPATNFNNLEKEYNLEELVKNATLWYDDNASPFGVAKSFLKIMKDKFGD